MIEIYRVHFGYSKRSKYYPQAIELAQMAEKYVVYGEDEDSWHVVTLTDEQIDLLATLYGIASKLPLPKIFGADIQYTYAYCLSDGSFNYFHASNAYKERVYAAVEKLQQDTGKSLKDLAVYLQEKYLSPISQDMSKVLRKLKMESRIDYIDPITQTWVRAKNKPLEPVNLYNQIRELVAAKKYTQAVDNYYLSLGSRYYSELTSELIYLKRLANVPLTGRDLLYFRSQSSRVGLISSNLSDYVLCIDEILTHLKDNGRNSPLEILLEYAPTMEQVVENRKNDWHMGVYLWGGEFKMHNPEQGAQ